MKTAIVYYSRHHENTKMLIDAIAAGHEVDLIPMVLLSWWEGLQKDIPHRMKCQEPWNFLNRQ